MTQEKKTCVDCLQYKQTTNMSMYNTYDYNICKDCLKYRLLKKRGD